MQPATRRQLYQTELKKISGEQGAFVIFTGTSDEKTIQFANTESEGTVLLDIPSSELSSGQPTPESLTNHFSDLDETTSPHGSSYTKECTIPEAVDAIESFFTDLCELPDNHGVEVNLNLNDVDCFVCEETHKGSELDYSFVETTRFRELNVPEERLQTEIENTIELQKYELSHEGDYTDEEIKEAAEQVYENHPQIFVPLCESCSSDI